jgi:hypothetical protein
MRRENAGGCPCHSRMGQDQRRRAGLGRRLDQLHGGVGHVDHDAQPIALGDSVASERRQAALIRRFGLVVSHVAPEEVHHLHVPHAAPVHRADALQLAFQKLASLDSLHDGRRAVPMRHFQISPA